MSALAEPGRALKARGGLRLSPRALVGAASVLLFILAWELVVAWGWVDPRLISRPSRIFAAGFQLIGSGKFGRHLRLSVWEFTVGMLPALVAGIAFGLLLGWYRRLALLFEPLVMALYSLPRMALLPLLFLWFGVTGTAQAVVVFLGAIFPIIVNTMTGIRQVEPIWLKAARSLNASEGQIFLKILLPGCLPYMMAGVRLGLGRGLMSVVIAEMMVSIAGVGHLIMTYQAGLNVEMLFFLIGMVAFTGVVLVQMVRWLEGKIAPWKQEEGR